MTAPLAGESWVRIPDRLPSTPQSRRAGVAAMGVHVLGLCVARVNLSDGVVMRQDIAYLGADPDGPEVARLVDVGLWEVIADGWRIVDYAAYGNTTREEVQRRSEAAAKAGRASAAARRRKAVEVGAEDAPPF